MKGSCKVDSPPDTVTPLMKLTILVCVFGGYMWAGGNLGAIWQPAEFLIIIGAAAGSLPRLWNRWGRIEVLISEPLQVYRPIDSASKIEVGPDYSSLQLVIVCHITDVVTCNSLNLGRNVHG